MKQSTCFTILCAGECLLELHSYNGLYKPAFAGDVINFSIYLKRLCPNTTVKFFSAIGNDSNSTNMLDFFHREAINTELVSISPNKSIGLYMVHIDNTGERSFSYWRSDSAAKQMFSLINQQQLYKAASNADFFYFSGVTLAIVDKQSKEQLLAFATQLRNEGKTIIFDPNVRLRLWKDQQEATTYISQAYAISHILLSSYDDEHLLFGLNDIHSMLEHAHSFAIDEVILTHGSNTIVGINQGTTFTVEPTAPTKVVDTTSAGDAFNAAYIAARCNDIAPQQAVEQASSLAATVIAHAGAIIDKSDMPLLPLINDT